MTRLTPKYPGDAAGEIARKLVHQYPEHGFFIDFDEASRIGLDVSGAEGDTDAAIEGMIQHIQDTTLIGRLEELP